MTPHKPSLEIPGAYHDGSRQLQDHFDSRRIADRLEQVNARSTFSDHDRAFIEASPMFFLATADPEGWPDCSYKGGMPGFVRVTDEHSLAFPGLRWQWDVSQPWQYFGEPARRAFIPGL